MNLLKQLKAWRYRRKQSRYNLVRARIEDWDSYSYMGEFPAEYDRLCEEELRLAEWLERNKEQNHE